MARFEIANVEGATLGEANADSFFDLGMMYSIGRSVRGRLRLRAQVVQYRGDARKQGGDPPAPGDRRANVGERDRRRPACRTRLAQRPLTRALGQRSDLACKAAVGHIHAHGDVAEWLKAAVC